MKEHVFIMSNMVRHVCSVDGGWSDYGPWSNCTESCGGGKQNRNRTCNNPVPKHGGKKCADSDTDERKCNTQPCPSKVLS